MSISVVDIIYRLSYPRWAVQGLTWSGKFDDLFLLRNETIIIITQFVSVRNITERLFWTLEIINIEQHYSLNHDYSASVISCKPSQISHPFCSSWQFEPKTWFFLFYTKRSKLKKLQIINYKMRQKIHVGRRRYEAW